MSSSRSLVGEVMRLELNYLLRKGYIQKGRGIRGSISWTKSGNWGSKKCGEITIESTYPQEGPPRLRLLYSITEHGKKTDYDYTINLAEIPSNLGRGSILYFICPETFQYCRKLYLAYGSPRFYSRGAYSRRCRLYYDPQLDSHGNRANTVYWRVKRQLEEMNKRRSTYRYNGKPTRRALRLERLKNKRDQADLIRWDFSCYPATVRIEKPPQPLRG